MPTFSSSTFLLFVVSLLALTGSQQTQAKNALQARIDPLVKPYLDSKTVMGLTIGVLHKGKAKVIGYGRVSEKNPKKPDGNTVYEIGSMSKVFTGLLLADAVGQGRVRLDQPATELLPVGVKMPQHENRQITLLHLATHASGLPRMPDQFAPADPNNPYADYTVDQLHDFLNRHQLARAPGEKSKYSNLGMGLLGHLLALQAEQPYEQLLRNRITKPLGMSSTSINLSKKQLSRLAPPHTVDHRPATNWDIPTLAGAGAIRSTARDLLLFAKAHLSPPKNELGKAIELAWKAHQEPPAGRRFGRGLAWSITLDGGMGMHSGQTGGYHSKILISRKLDIAVVLLTNTATDKVDRLATDILLSVVGSKVEPRSFEKTKTITPEIMQRYVGIYAFSPGLMITVTMKDKQLMVQLTGQQSLKIFARTETEWFLKAVKASITFKMRGEKCHSLELFQNGIRQTAKRVEVETLSTEESITVSPKKMQRYVGKYQLAPGAIFSVTMKNKQLLVQLTGQPAMPIFARAETEWFPKVFKATITFNMNGDQCQSLELFQGGIRQTAQRIGVEPRGPEKSIKVTPELMQRYVGKYQFAPGLLLTVTAKDNQLYVQLTGQQALPVYPRTETEWFLKVVEATVTFNVDAKGKCHSLELFQNGVRQTAKRIK